MRIRNRRWQVHFVCLCIFIAISFNVSAQNQFIFKRFTIEDGLSSESVLSIAQDKKGFLWVGTMDGLNRYDGKNVRIFRNFYRDNPIGPSIKITCLLADSLNQIWIGTNNGLYVYNNATDSFSVFFHSPQDPQSISNSIIKSLLLDTHGEVWVGTAKGLNKIKHNDGKYRFLRVHLGRNKKLDAANVLGLYETANGKLLAGTGNGVIELKVGVAPDEYEYLNSGLDGVEVVSICQDKDHRYWIGSSNSGLYNVDENFKVIKHYRQDAVSQDLLSNVIRKVFVDSKERIWVGTLKGLNLFYPEIEKSISYVHQSENRFSLTSNSIYELIEDRQGNIWIGTFFGGLNYIEANTTPFKAYQKTADVNTISSNIISAIVEDERKNLWIGTEAEGLNYFDRRKQTFRKIRNVEADNRTLSSNLVKALVTDKYKKIWVAMHGGGVNVLDQNGKKLREFGFDKGVNSISSNDVIALLFDSNENIWMGTEEDGVDIYNQSTGNIEEFESFRKGQTLTSDAITCMFEDSKRNIWIGTRQGVNLLAYGKPEVRKFFKGQNSNQLKSDYINCIAEDKSKRIWFGTYAGLSFYDSAKNEFRTYTVNEGLAANKVVGIVVDDQNNLWISTSNGLSFLGADRSTFHSFTVNDGLPGNVFNYKSVFKDYQGHLFFGTYNGLVEFDPRKISMNMKSPDIVLTGFQVNGQYVNTRDSSGILSKNITETRELVLDYDQNVITVEYAVMNFIKSAKNKSAYKLEGYNKDWINTDEHKAAFTNLPAGKYTLFIKACNNDGVWGELPFVLKVTVKPPPWKTWWAYSLYAIIISLIAFAIIFFFTSRTALKRKLRYEHLVNVKQEELHQMKMNFFTHISHEIRTPLTLITGPVEVLSDLMLNNAQAQKLLGTIKGNTDRLLKLTNELLDFRKADSGNIQLIVTCANIAEFVHTQFLKFNDAAEKKSITYTFETTNANIPLYFDAHYLEIVISNLLSNAIKFTSNGGIVTIHVLQTHPDSVEIKICDNGVGIPVEAQSRIFNNFYQADAGGLNHTGSGIGLAFSKSLVELHNGKLDFHSGVNSETEAKQTCFIVTLLTGKSHFNGNCIIKE